MEKKKAAKHSSGKCYAVLGSWNKLKVCGMMNHWFSSLLLRQLIFHTKYIFSITCTEVRS